MEGTNVEALADSDEAAALERYQRRRPLMLELVTVERRAQALARLEVALQLQQARNHFRAA